MSKDYTPFSNSGLISQIGDEQPVLATISGGRGSNSILKFIAVGDNVGTQASRIQIDSTADGNFHVIGATDGIGSYNMTFMDGPFITCDRKGRDKADSALEFYLSRKKDLESRQVVVRLYNKTSGSKRSASSQPSAKFRGILKAMSVRLVSADEAGTAYISVGLNMLGSWEC